MNDLFIYISLALMVLLLFASTLIYKKLRIWKLVLVIINALVYGAIKYIPDLITFITNDKALEYFTYFLFFNVVLLAMTFKNKIKITQNLTDYDFFELEKELDDLKNVSDLLRKRFISTIGLVNEGLIFYDEDLEGMFITGQASKTLSTDKSDFTVEEYLSFINREDQSEYLSVIKKANKKNPNFEVKYRVKRGSSYTWVVEKGQLVTHKKKEYLISTIKGIDMKIFPETMIHELDSIPDESQMTQYLSQERKDKEVFYLVLMHLTNIPDINRRFGRDVGNLMIAEYIKKMRYHFARERNSMFRVTGIEFALIIKEEQKFDVLKRALVSGGDLINLRLNIGGIQQVVYPNVGIIKNDPWSNYEIDDFISLGQKTLDEAIRNNKKNFSVFGE